MGILFALLLTSGRTVQAFVNKKGTSTLDSGVMALAFALMGASFFWLLGPFLPSLWKPDATALLWGVLGGFARYYCVKFTLDVRRDSNSAAMFIGFIAPGIAAPLNVGFLGEGLSAVQLISCIAIGLLGAVFFMKGAASELSPSGKKAFAIALFWLSIILISNQAIIERTNWYMNGVFAYTSYLVVALFMIGRAKLPLAPNLKQPILWYCGAVYAMLLWLTLYSSDRVLGVSITQIFQNLSVPVIMLLSHYIYRERTAREQLIFGLLAFIIALPLIL